MMFNSSVICETPSIISSANEKYIPVTVSLNDGYDYSDDSMLYFRYHNELVIESVTPTRGSKNGGTVVSILGANIPPRVDIQCRFGDNKVSGYFDEFLMTIICHTPRSNFSGMVTIDLKIGTYDWKDSGFNFQYNEPLFIDNIITDNAIPPLLFEYNIDFTINDALPLLGPSNGGTMVQVHGTGFDKNITILCRFGDYVTVAVIKSEILLLCFSRCVLLLYLCLNITLAHNIFTYYFA